MKRHVHIVKNLTVITCFGEGKKDVKTENNSFTPPANQIFELGVKTAEGCRVFFSAKTIEVLMSR